MKTFFVVAEAKVDGHTGEEYDDIIEVEDQPTTETIHEWANRIRNRIRRLWVEDVPPEGADRSDDDPQGVAVYLDAATPYNAMLQNLRIIMGADEDIVVELPYLGGSVRDTSDPEAKEILRRLDANAESEALT